jgi:hypothetical protein
VTDLLLVPGQGWVTAVPAWRATGDERARALSAFEATRLLSDLRRSGDRRGLFLLYRAASRFEPSAPNLLRDATLVAAIEAALTRGELLLVRADLIGRPIGATRTEHSPQQHLIDAVMQGRSTLSFEGRTYRFAAADGWRPHPSEAPHVPVRAQTARELVARMAASRARTPADHASWEALAAALVGPQAGPGVLMLRSRDGASVPGATADVPRATPSQLAASIAHQDWLELQLDWDDGTPVDENFVLALPGGRATYGPPDPGGMVRVDGLASGDCKLTFPDLFPARH